MPALSTFMQVQQSEREKNTHATMKSAMDDVVIPYRQFCNGEKRIKKTGKRGLRVQSRAAPLYGEPWIR